MATTGARASMVKRIGSVAGAIGLAFLGGCSTQGDRESRGEDRAYRRAVVPILQRAGELHNFGDFVDGESTPTDMGAAEAAESLYILRAAVVALPPAEDKRVRYLSLRLMRLAEAGLDLAARIDLVTGGDTESLVFAQKSAQRFDDEYEIAAAAEFIAMGTRILEDRLLVARLGGGGESNTVASSRVDSIYSAKERFVRREVAAMR